MKLSTVEFQNCIRELNQVNGLIGRLACQSTLPGNIMSYDSVLNELMNERLKIVKKLHPYQISPPNPEKKTNRWQTYVKAGDKAPRKLVTAHSEADLWQKLMEYYCSEMHFEKMTFGELYQEWIEYKEEISNSSNTILRHKQRYNRYYKDSTLPGMRIRALDLIAFEAECNNIVKAFDLSRKEWTNAKTIMNGMFKYAIRKGYMTENPLDRITIYVRFRQVVKKSSRTQVYSPDEKEQFFDYLEEMYADTCDSTFLAVKLQFYTGLRVGELVALKWDDIEDGDMLHVVREETLDKTLRIYSVANHTKTNQDRYVYLIPDAIKLLERIDKTSEYIFTNDGERLTSRAYNYVLEKFAERNGSRTKSSHKIRKTYASTLNANSVPLDAIRQLLGHQDLATTLSYIYNPFDDNTTRQLIESALSPK